jgi:hypothetical protein
MKDEELTSNDWELLDRIAALTIDPDRHFKEIMETYQRYKDLRPTGEILAL